MEELKPNYELTEEERKYIYHFGVKGIRKSCHMIAQKLCMYSNGKIKCYEGCMIIKGGLIINHSWNMYNGKVIDLIALNKNNPLHKNIIKYVGYDVPFTKVRDIWKREYFGLMDEEKVWKLESQLWKKRKK